MKKILALMCAALMLIAFTGCGVAESLADAKEQAEALPVAVCVQAAADGDEATFQSYLHPSVSEEAQKNGYAALYSYLHGSTVISTEVVGYNLHVSTGSFGKTQQISAKVLVTCDQGTLLFDLDYVENNEGSGFSQFLCSIGIAN